MSSNKRILVAPLNWGLGHATRCIPIIHALKRRGFSPIIASDGAALQLLNKEFPELISLELPSYNIEYSKKGKDFKLKLIKDSPRIIKTIKTEKKAVKQLIEEYNISGIISDNRFGVYNKSVPSIFITHQLKVLSGNTTWFSTKLHEKIIKKFNECWVPDQKGEFNLSGKLGHVDSTIIKTKYIGPLSRFEKKKLPKKYDLMVLLSGPEPQRSILETKLLKLLKDYNGTVLFVKGVVEASITEEKQGLMKIINYLTTQELEEAFNTSDLILSRSGYTTLMDLAKLDKKAFFIPTPGQFEQEYLAERLHKLNIAPSCNQDDFTLEKLNLVSDFKGLSNFEYELNYKKLFSLF
ncbi:glycosyltransferase [Hanstruepera marina]|uniref:glycosyltransferase n=1 Tax=Hanstruepera marina TaxID=2873265 RepID=UPI001CA611C8|nr:glycosyltransferase [Hanstruepera marina]